MRYFGSKAFAAPVVCKELSKRIPNGTVCDPFGGIGVVGTLFKEMGYTVLSGDHLTFPHYFQIALIESNRTPSFRKLRDHLGLDSLSEFHYWINTKKKNRGWLVREYSEKRHFFTRDNARKIEAIRALITNWTNADLITYRERAFLLASLINSFDKVANTAGTYYAYLKSWHRKALNPFKFDLLHPQKGATNCRSLLSEAKDITQLQKYDILYLDPPYNARSYGHYYHLPETIALQKTPRVHGMSGIPLCIKPISDFSRPALSVAALKEIVENADFNVLAFHYSDNGLISAKEIQNILRPFGRVEKSHVQTKGYTTKQTPRTIDHTVYIVENG